MTSRGKAKGLNAGSFVDLKAEIAQQKEDIAKARAAGKKLLTKPVKKASVWSKKNRGVDSRSMRDVETEMKSHRQYDSAYGNLEKKARMYKQLKRGQTAGLSEAEIQLLLVEFDGTTGYEDSDSDLEEASTVPVDDDPMTEYEDEHGRTRRCRKSEVPREFLLRPGQEVDDDEDIIIRNPVNRYVIYEGPDLQEKQEAFKKAREDQDKPPEDSHFDRDREPREMGAGGYRFSSNEEERQREMAELKRARDATKAIRTERGAEDQRVEGMAAPETEFVPVSSALKKRRADMEARKQQLEAKRRKLQGSTIAPPPSPGAPPPPPPLEAFTTSRPRDPFSALEQQSKGPDTLSAADEFLASIVIP